MLDDGQAPLHKIVDVLRVIGEPTRLRILSLLSKSDLTVTDLIEILGQSQPRVSRHLKLLVEAGLAERYQEGSWVYLSTSDDEPEKLIVSSLLEHLDPNDSQVQRDTERLDSIICKRAKRAEEYFASNSECWDEVRKMHIDEKQVEKTILAMIGKIPVQRLLDMGTGTGRMLELLSGIYEKALGVDINRDMLAVARSTIDQAALYRAQVRQGNITMMTAPVNHFDLVTLHQVLHYLDNPQEAIVEAARVLAPGGRMLIVDFAPHARDELRMQHAHVRLGFSHEQMQGWFEEVGLEILEMRDLKAPYQQSDYQELLTVTLWLACNRRMPVAMGKVERQND